MKIRAFQIKNYKGILKTRINLSDEVPGNVITLIGLNESGKTTILEALSHFVTDDAATASLVNTVQKKPGLQDLIPKERKAAFTDTISISAEISLDEQDVDDLEEFFLSKRNLALVRDGLARVFSVDRIYRFQDSVLSERKALWSPTFKLRPTGKKVKSATIYSAAEATREVWLDGIAHLRERLPKIIYFPTLLFNFPDRIYLEETHIEPPNGYYCEVIQDILDAQSEGISLQKHIVDRIVNRRSEGTDPATFSARFMGLDEKGQIDAVTQKISNEMSRVIFGAWGDILERKIINKRVQVDWALDTEQNNTPYLQVSLIDGQSRYALSERSLGFRWFFSFLLFTQFRKSRGLSKGTIFLFDEPAANLHSRAQIRLLKSFSKIAADNTHIIYSTHSHYMIDPLWLEKAYIVENEALNYDSDEDLNSFSGKKTNIKATKYRNFVGQHPNRASYFQPVLDALSAGPSLIDPDKFCLLIEGKFDYHPLCYFKSFVTDNEEIAIIPASGASTMGALISLLRGRGSKFAILLDDDKAGRTAKRRYLDEYLLLDEQVKTLGDVLPAETGKSFDQIFEADVLDAARAYFSSASVDKRQLSQFFLHLIHSKASEKFDVSRPKFDVIFKWAQKQFQS